MLFRSPPLLPPAFSLATDHPPNVWLGGLPISFTLPQDTSLYFATFRGCLYDLIYTITEANPVLIDPATAAFQQYVTAAIAFDSFFHSCSSYNYTFLSRFSRPFSSLKTFISHLFLSFPLSSPIFCLLSLLSLLISSSFSPPTHTTGQ